MKTIEFWTYASKLPRDGMPIHAVRIDGVKAVCGAGGVSFGVGDKYKKDGSVFSRWVEYTQRWDRAENLINCVKCQSLLFPSLDEYHKPIPVEVGEYRYMGHFIQDQREFKAQGLPPWVTVADVESAEHVPHWSFADAKTHCKTNRIDNPDTQVSDYI